MSRVNQIIIEGKIDSIDEVLQNSFNIIFDDENNEEDCGYLQIAYDKKFKDVIKEGNIVRIVGRMGCDPDGEIIVYPEHIEKVNN